MSIVRICLWSGPRNISTALMYSFAQRSDTQVFDEPLYAHYLSHCLKEEREKHPSYQEVLNSLDNNGDNVIKMMMGPFESEVVFFKNMTHHLKGVNRDFLDSVVNVILTRNPEDMLPSFSKVIKNPSLNDVGYADHVELLELFRENGIKPVIVESREVLNNPEKQLKRICAAACIPFESAMLKWQRGARKEDGVWARHWYSGTHKSTGFEAYVKKPDPFPENLKPLLNKCLPLYNQLIK
jgi:predicted regulator of amino acid metabolism with ACT domain